jgi:glutaredoxin 3
LTGRRVVKKQNGSRIMPKNVEMYTKPGCGHCGAARRLLKSSGIAFIQWDVADDPKLFDEMKERAQGRITVPQIFVDNVLIGGNSELQEIATQGKLDLIFNS